jgi:hypothetical protein
MQGVLQGANLHLPRIANSFTWHLAISGRYSERGGSTQRASTVTSGAARFDGSITSRSGELVGGIGTMTIMHPEREDTFLAAPMNFSARQGPGQSVDEGALDELTVVAGPGATAAIVDGTLTGTFAWAAFATQDEDPLKVTLDGPPVFSASVPVAVSGSVATHYGHPVVAQVQIHVDGTVAQAVNTDSQGRFQASLSLSAQPHQVQAVTHSGTPFVSRSQAITLLPQHRVTVSTLGTGSVSTPSGVCTGSCQYTVVHGSTFVATALPGPHHALSRWTQACTHSANECSTVVNSDAQMSASFILFNADIEESEPNDSPQAADPMLMTQRVAGGLTAGDEDWYRFTMTSMTLMRFETFDKTLTGCAGTMDTMIAVHRSDQSLIALDDDSGPGLCSKLEILVPSGTTFVQIRPYGTTTASSYRLVISSLPGPNGEVEPNDTTINSQHLPLPAEVIGSIYPGTDRDRFRFQSSGDYYRIETHAYGGATCSSTDTIIELRSSNGMLMKSDDDSGEGLCSRMTEYVPTGVHLVDVISFDAQTIGAYRLTIQPYEAP